jgi:regulator of nonsense transcripts 2
MMQRLQEQDRRNHEAYIRSGEIFEDRQQAYEKMTKSYEKLLASSQTYVLKMYVFHIVLKGLTTRLSELLYLPMPSLPSSSSTGNSIQIGTNAGGLLSDDAEEAAFAALGGKWEDEEERRFFEDIQDLREIVPKSILGIEASKEVLKEVDESDAEAKKNAEDEEVKRLQEELAGLEAADGTFRVNGKADLQEVAEEEDDRYEILLLASFPWMTQVNIASQRRYPYTFYSKGGFASDHTDSCPTGSLATTHRSACAFAGLYEPHPHRPSRC